MKPSGYVGQFFCAHDVEALRASPPVTRWAIADESINPPPREPHPEGEARRQEIIEAHDRWVADRKAVEDATGYTALVDLAEGLAVAWDAIDKAVMLHQPCTIEGLARKAALVAHCLSLEIGYEDFAITFAQQVAAFGGVTA